MSVMIKKLKNKDFLFVTALIIVFLIHLVFVFIVPYSDDESYYVITPFRLLNGDSLVQHDWHLTQFSSLFNILPVYIWTAVKGSFDGIFIFLRGIYLAIHTTMAVAVYRFFRKYGLWAIMASMMFYVQIPYRFLAINYQSVYAVSLLLICLCLLKIYEKKSTLLYIVVGLGIGCCCVCNPFFCAVYVLYLLGCALWTKRYDIIRRVISVKTSQTFKQKKKLTKRQKREQKEQQEQVLKNFPNIDNYNCFFTKEAILKISCGILIVAIIAVTFFFLTGGTINSVFSNIENLLGSSEYDIASSSVFDKIIATLGYFNTANLNMSLILPLLFIVLMFDKNRRHNSHRLAYLVVAVVWSIIFMVGVMVNIEIFFCAISLPFAVLSTFCYILSKKKNKTLFYCMSIPCLIATFFQYLAADTHLGVIGVVLAIYNIAGVFFSRDLYNEMRFDSKENSKEVIGKDNYKGCHRIIIIGFCLQILFYGIFYQYNQFEKDAVKATVGPYSGLYMSETKYDRYNRIINDLDIIKACSSEDDQILVVSYSNWTYLYLERPMATYSAWYRGAINSEQLIRYYKKNSDKRPRYIYIESSDPNGSTVQTATDILSDMFIFAQEPLSNGVLLTVEDCKF